ncbi:tetratricopeptide repeat protein [Specibacter sp. NPDC057265]|uniref:tetratricopeptide repeat protein n=1 Tax=Specibacter sp. NPDC057265 TaxID=3346075 RepID=UPI003627FCF6
MLRRASSPWHFRDCGRNDEALRVALKALASTLPLYGRAASAYSVELLQHRAPGTGRRCPVEVPGRMAQPSRAH